MASSLGYQARRAAGPEAAAAMYVNLAELNRSPRMQESLKNSQPLVTLLLAGLIEPLRQSTWLAMTLDVHDKSLMLRDGRRPRRGPQRHRLVRLAASPTRARCPIWPSPAASPPPVSTATCTASTPPRTSSFPSGPPA